MTAAASVPETAPGRAARALRGGLVGAVLVAATLPAVDAVYAPGWLVPVLGAVAGAVLVHVVVATLVARGAAAALVPLQVGGAVLWAVSSVPPAVDGATALGGLTDATARLLTSLPPIDPRGPELAVAVVATWAATALGAGAASRRDAGLVAALPAALVFVGALLVGGSRRALPDRVPIALAGAVGVALVVFAVRRSSWASSAQASGPGQRTAFASASARTVARSLSGLLLAAVAIALGVIVTPSVPGLEDRPRVDVRAGREPPVDVQLDENPLDAVPVARRESPADDVRFIARVRLPAGHDSRLAWRLALLDQLGPDGWTRSPASYVRAGTVLGSGPADEAEHRARARVELDLGRSFTGLAALPTLDRPTSVEPAGLAFDRTDGVLAVPLGRDRPARLTMEVALPVLTGAEVASATVTRVEPEDIPPAIALRAQQITGPAATPLRALALIASALASDEALTLDATRTGLTRTALVEDQLLAGAEGRSEVVNDAQLAAAFALLARADGFPVRLAVGYLTAVASRTETLRVTDSSLTVWPEVRLDGLGWVPFPPRPPAGGGSETTDPLTTAAGGVVDQAVTQEAEAAARERAPAGQRRATPPAPPAAATGGEAGRPWLALGVISTAVVLVTAVSLGPGGRALRRRSRRRTHPRAQVVGAWDEAADVLVAASRPVTADDTRPEVVARVGPDLPDETGEELAWLASSADGVAFGASEATAEDAARAWRVVAALGPAARRDLSRRARLRAFLRPPRRLRTATGPSPRRPRRPGRSRLGPAVVGAR